MIELGFAQGAGNRDYQEDSYGYTTTKGKDSRYFLVLADGMGGLEGGEMISAYVVKRLISQAKKINTKHPVHTQLEDMIRQLNYDIEKEEIPGGSTLVIAYFNEQELYWACVGDSRLYLMRNGRLYQMNEDADYMNQLLVKVINKEMSYQAADNDPQRDHLAQYMGRKKELVIDSNMHPFNLKSGDKLLLCSDGVYNALSEKELAMYMQSDAQPSANSIAMAIDGLDIGHQDNFTAMIVHVV